MQPSIAVTSSPACVLIQVSLDVRGKRNLHESLDLYVQGELMEGDNQYFCETAGKKARSVGLLLARQAPARTHCWLCLRHTCGIYCGMWHAGRACRQSLTCQPL